MCWWSAGASAWLRCVPLSARCCRAGNGSDACRAGTARGRRRDCSTWRSSRHGAARGCDVAVTVDAAAGGWRGHVGVVTPLLDRLRSTPRRTTAFLCGPEVMMRVVARDLIERRSAIRTGSSSRWSATCSCAVRPVRALPARARCSSAPTVPSSAGPTLPLSSRCGDGEPRQHPTRPTLAVWKFASCDGCQLIAARLRGRAARAGRARSRSPTSWRPPGPRSRARTTSPSSRARSRPPHDAERIQRGPRGSRARLVTIGACATAGGIQALRNFADVEEFTLDRLRHAGLHLDAGHLHADLRPRPGRLRAARLPDRQAPAARGDRRRHPGDRSRTIPATASASSASGAATSA